MLDLSYGGREDIHVASRFERIVARDELTELEFAAISDASIHL